MRYERLRRVGGVEAGADGGDGGYALAETEMTVTPAAQMTAAAAMQTARTTKEVAEVVTEALAKMASRVTEGATAVVTAEAMARTPTEAMVKLMKAE